MARLVAGLVAAALVACLDLAVAGCDRGPRTDPDVPTGGTDANAGRVVLEDVWIDAPHGARAGADTGLRMFVDNESGHADALVEVSTPLARSVRMLHDGRQVRRLAVPAGTARDLEWRPGHDGVELVHLRRPVARGQWFPLTVTFAHSPAVTMEVTVGPLGPRHPE